jgi:hypothetical protein
MAPPNAAKPAPAATGNQLQNDQLGGSINPKFKQSRRKDQQPLSYRAAYLERQRRVAERAERRLLAELARRNPPASWHDYAVAGFRHGRQFPNYARALHERGGK